MDLGGLGLGLGDLKVNPSPWECISLLLEWIGTLGVDLVYTLLNFGALELSLHDLKEGPSALGVDLSALGIDLALWIQFARLAMYLGIVRILVV